MMVRIVKYAALPLVLLTGCVKDMTDTQHASKSVEVSEVSITNDARNTTLYINDCNVCDVTDLVMECGDTIICEVTQKKDTIVLDGGITSNGISLYRGVMLAPFGSIVKSFDLCDSLGDKILHPIGFEVNVNDWER